MHNKVNRKYLLLPGIVLSHCTLAIAETDLSAFTAAENKDRTINTILIQDSAIDNPAPSVSRISTEQIQEAVNFNLKDVFRSTPEVSVGGGSQSAQRLYLNGIEGSNLNISIDGVRNGRNLHQHRGNFNGPDSELLKQVEVHSTSGVTSGPGALGGSISMTTLDAQDLLHQNNKTEGFGGQIKTGYSSVDEGKHGDIRLYGMLSDHLGILLNTSADNRNDYRTGSNRTVIGSGGQDRDYRLKLSLLDFHQQNIRASISHTQNAGLYSRGSNGSDMGYLPDDPFGPSVRLRQETSKDQIAFEHHWSPDDPLFDLKTNLYHTQNKLHYPNSYIADIKTKENGLNIRNRSRFNLLDLPSSLTVGSDWFKETAYTNALEMGDTTNWPTLNGQPVEYDNKNLGIYLENSTEIGALTATFGIRLDDFDSDYGPIQLSGHELSPAFHLNYAFDSGIALFTGYSEAARAGGIIPVMFLARFNPNMTGQLKPETSRQQEVGIRYTSPLWPLNLQLRAFETRINNSIQTVGRGNQPLGEGDLYNGEQLTVKGWQFNSSWQYNQYSSTLGVNITDVKYGNNPPGAVRRLTAPSGDTLTWDNRWQPINNLTFGYTLKLVADLKDVPENEPKRDGYDVHSLRAQWLPIPALTLGITIDNLFDCNYASHTSLYSDTTGILDEPGRDIRLSMAYTF